MAWHTWQVSMCLLAASPRMVRCWGTEARGQLASQSCPPLGLTPGAAAGPPVHTSHSASTSSPLVAFPAWFSLGRGHPEDLMTGLAPLTPGDNPLPGLHQPCPGKPQFAHPSVVCQREEARCGGEVGRATGRTAVTSTGVWPAPPTLLLPTPHKLCTPQATRWQYSQESAWSFRT